MTKLFKSIQIRGEKIKNRSWVSPMCQYSSKDGYANNWHMVHLGSRAVGGSGLVMTEAAAVEPEGRISPWDLGIWKDEHIDALKNITDFIKEQNSTPAIQLAHAGRKASTKRPWEGRGRIDKKNGGWIPKAPSPISFDQESQIPSELTIKEIEEIIGNFVKAAERSIEAGFRCIELHLAHGYLAHEFFSPISNTREDNFGGNFENRTIFGVEISKRIREKIGEEVPILARISSTEYHNNGWNIGSSIKLAKMLKKAGVDLIDCSSGGNYSEQIMKLSPGYQVPFSKKIKSESGILTGAVGLITETKQAEEILEKGEADAIFLGRELLRNPYWNLYSQENVEAWPVQYQRSFESFDKIKYVRK
ncbi:MAG: oxidoreductase [Chloroflexi bacterium]|nr:oxidoreductase [Chloroflexota bacterium]|tara:strand:- start:14275 stop:15360 length:1086 start_codon:yes stop_codon:yes gene_type:complete